MRGQANTQTRSNLINRNEGEQDTPVDARNGVFRLFGESVLPGSTPSTAGRVFMR
jgi:hypothetical protein